MTLLALASGAACVGSNGVPSDPGAGGSAGHGGSAAGGGGGGGGGTTVGGGGGASGQLTGAAGANGTGSGGAGGIGPTSYLPWTDGFEDPAFDAQYWQTADTNGTWSVIVDGSHVYQAVAGETETIAVTGNVNWVDQLVQIKVKVVSASSTSWAIDLLPRFADLRDYYQLTLSESSLALHVRVDNSRTELVTKYKTPAPLTTGTWHTLQFSIKNGAGGALITASLDGVMALTTTDPMPLPNGGVGLGVTDATAEFDDLSVTLPP